MAAAVACTISTTGLLEAVTALAALGAVNAAVKVVANGTIATLSTTLVRPNDTSVSVDALTSITGGTRAIRVAHLKAAVAAVPSSVGTVALAFFDAAGTVPAYWTLTYGSNPQRVVTVPNVAAG